MTREGKFALSAPRTAIHTDEGTLQAADEWIATLHPHSCQEAFQELTPPEYHTATTAARLLVHLLDHHDATFQDMVRYQGGWAHPTGDVGIAAAIRRAPRLLTSVLDALPSVEASKEARTAAGLVLHHADPERFPPAFNVLWPQSDIPFPHFAGLALRAAAFGESNGSLAIDFLTARLSTAWQTSPEETLRALAYSPHLDSHRDSLLANLLRIGGVPCARCMADFWPYDEPHPIVLEATRFLLEHAPSSPALPKGLARCLALDAPWSLRILEEWANGPHMHGHDGDLMLAHQVQKHHAAEALDILASGILQRTTDGPVHHVYASGHHRIVEDPKVIIAWLQRHLHEPPYARYAASLIAETLSKDRPAPTPEQSQELRQLAHDLHARHGATPKQKVQARHRLGTEHIDQLAIALCNDVMHPPEKVDIEEMIRTLSTCPHMRAALGGEKVEKYLREGGDLPHAWMLEDTEAELAKLAVEERRPDAEGSRIEWERQRTHAVAATRQRWEDRFAHIAKHGIVIRPKHQRQLREKPEVWNEIRVLDRLVDHFEVDIEPRGILGLGDKKLDFHLKCPEGELLLEVTTMTGSPDDLFKGAKVSTGDEAKNALNRKLHGQLAGGQAGTRLPVVLALFVPHRMELEYGVLNSLYGPLQVSWSQDEAGKVTREGVTRGVELGFLAPENARIVAGIATLVPDEDEAGALIGELHPGHSEAKHPLNRQLWVRLRTALFGKQGRAHHHMSGIPDISAEEVMALMERGIDSVPHFAADMYLPGDYPPSIPEARLAHLRTQVRRRHRFARKGQVRDMDAAQGIDINPLSDAGLLLARDLLTASKPAAFPDAAWERLQAEARVLYPPSLWDKIQDDAERD